jgi:hypothetical protein
MSNRLTKGRARVGSIACDTSGGVLFDKDQATLKVKVLSFQAAASTAENDTAFDFPSNGILHDVWVKVTAASTAGGVISVGLLSSESGGDADGLIVNLGSSATGTYRGGLTSSTSGATGSFVTGSKRGALIAVWSSGSTAADDPGMYAEKPHLFSSVTAKSVSWTTNSSGAALAGLIYLQYTEI